MASPRMRSFHPSASSPVTSSGGIQTITPHFGNTSSHLVLSHATPEISILDAGTLQIVKAFRGVHEEDVASVVTSASAGHDYHTDGVDQGKSAGATISKSGIWTAGKDGKVVNWDERSGSASQVITGTVSSHAKRLLQRPCSNQSFRAIDSRCQRDLASPVVDDVRARKPRRCRIRVDCV